MGAVSNVRGVVILLRNGFDCKIKQKYVDPAGRCVGIQAQINDRNFYLFNVYGPNNDNQEVWSLTYRAFQRVSEKTKNILKSRDTLSVSLSHQSLFFSHQSLFTRRSFFTL